MQDADRKKAFAFHAEAERRRDGRSNLTQEEYEALRPYWNAYQAYRARQRRADRRARRAQEAACK